MSVKVEHYISELLFEYDCVIIPGFGGFVTNYASATIHPTQHVFTSPGKNIVFNKSLRNNDGLLANHVSLGEKIDFLKAVKLIEEFAEGINSGLSRGKKVELLNIGTFHLDVEKNIQFKPDNTINYLLASYGLTEIQSPAIKRGNISERIEKEFFDRPAVVSEKPRARKKIWAMVGAIPVIAALIWIPYQKGLFDNVSYSAINPFAMAGPVEYVVRSEKVAAIIESDLTENEKPFKAVVVASAPVEAEVNSGPDKPVAPVETVKKTSTSAYYIVAGCFEYLENAEGLVKELQSKGRNAEIIGKNRQGLYRVSYSSFRNRKEALIALATAKQEVTEAWILRN